MKILITNNTLSSRCGSEMYVKEIAGALLARGHQIAAYSTILGRVAQDMREDGIFITDNLEQICWKPDIIHGQHHLDAMTAILHFPDVPAVFFCHGWRPWQETPPLHPRIIKYVAVDQATLDSAVQKYHIPAEKIRIIHNFVDLKRFRPRGRLPDKPRKALVFSNYASEANYLPHVRRACKEFGISVATIGLSSGNCRDHPEEVIGDYDLVFAYGRSAIESLAAGCALIICGVWGIGPMVTIEDFDRLRDLNFGMAAVISPVDSEAIKREIRRYDASDAEQAGERIRLIAGIDATVDKIIDFYREALDEYSSLAISAEEEARAASSYLRDVSELLKKRDFECNELKAEFEILKAYYDHIKWIKRAFKIPVAGRLLQPFKSMLKRALSGRSQAGSANHNAVNNE